MNISMMIIKIAAAGLVKKYRGLPPATSNALLMLASTIGPRTIPNTKGAAG
jgi:hypothetical protein